MTATQLKELLTHAFDGPYAEIHVRDDSHLHAGHHEAPPEGGSHFSVMIVSDKFCSLSKVRRHQLVYKVLNQAFQNGLHALALKTMTPDEVNHKKYE